jgi:hypothetical protein
MPCLASYTAVRYLQALTPDRAHIRGARTAELYPRRPSFLMHARNLTISYPAKRSDSCEAFDRRAKVLREKADHRPTHLLYAWTNGSACKCCERRIKNASRARSSNTSATAVARGEGLGWWLCCRLAAAGRTCHSPTLRKAAPFSRPACHLPDGATAVGMPDSAGNSHGMQRIGLFLVVLDEPGRLPPRHLANANIRKAK